MLRLLPRRAAVQWPLLAALLAVVVVGASLLGVCALLLTTSQDRGLEAVMARAPREAVRVTAYVTDVRGPVARSVTEDSLKVLTSALSAVPVTSAARASSAMRVFGTSPDGRPRWSYLAGVQDLSRRSVLISGRWPATTTPGTGTGTGTEVVVLEPTARALGLTVGSRVTLGAEVRPNTAPPITVTVVGVFRPLAGTGWDRDPLRATGFDRAYGDGRAPQGAWVYGPFVTDLGALFAGGSTLSRLEVTADPDLSGARSATLDATVTAVSGADRRLSRALGDRVGIERIASGLPAALAVARTQQTVTGAAVLVVALVGTVLTAVCLALAGRLAVTLRAGETALLSGLGASRGQQAAAALAESGVLALLGAALAIPLSGVVHAGLGRLPILAGTVHPGTPIRVTLAQVVAVTAGAVLLAAVLVIPALRAEPAQAVTRGRLGLLARSGADVALVGLALVGWWQLRAQPATTTGTDAVRVLAPALILFAGAAVAVRLAGPLLRLADAGARRSPGLVLPLAAFEAARRPQAVAAGLLVTLATAAGTFGLAFGATWQRSQHDQGDLRVGTDLALALPGPVAVGDGQAVAAAAGGTPSPVTQRGIAVGSWVGDAGDPPRLVAVDTTRAGDLLRGRLPEGTTWAQVGAALAPKLPVTGVALPRSDARPITIRGTAGPGNRVLVTPQLLLQDRNGVRIPCSPAPVPLDGHEHPIQLCVPLAAGLRLVGAHLQVEVERAPPAGAGATPGPGTAPLDVQVIVPGGSAGPGGPGWAVHPIGPVARLLARATVTLGTTPTATTVRVGATVALTGSPDQRPELLVTAFPAPGPVPVVISRRLADAVSTAPGRQLMITVAAVPVPVVVTRVLPAIPSAPGSPAILADVDLLSRALVASGQLTPPVDAWWVGRPGRPDAKPRTAALHLGEVTSRAGLTEDLLRGPLRAGLPTSLGVLVAASALLLLGGIALHITSDAEARAVDVARLRGLGLTRRDIRRSLLAQHGAVLLLLLAAGAAVGAAASRLMGPLLIRSDLGAAPLPEVLPSWPWAAEGGFLAVLLGGCLIAVTAVVIVQVRRADAAHLRVGA